MRAKAPGIRDKAGATSGRNITAREPLFRHQYTTIYNRFNRWAKKGRWRAIFEALAKPGEDAVALSLDSTSVKAHRCACGGKGGEQNQAIGRSRGGAQYEDPCNPQMLKAVFFPSS